MPTYNVTVTSPAIKQAIAAIATLATVVSIDTDGTIHAHVTAPDDWTGALDSRKIADALGSGATVVKV
jgi:hypothetical protein